MDVAGRQRHENDDEHGLEEDPEGADGHPAAGKAHLHQEVALEAENDHLKKSSGRYLSPMAVLITFTSVEIFKP